MPEKESKPVGIAKTVEEILKELGKDVKLARDGNNNWSVKEGLAKIKINYNPDNFFVAGDAYLCTLPSDTSKIKPLYQFLLQENFKMDSLVLSCVKQSIVLSCIMYDLDMTKEAGIEMFRDLFQKADYYDQLLEKEYGCRELLEE
jgi:serine protease Do